jgi:hypothetical protein
MPIIKPRRKVPPTLKELVKGNIKVKVGPKAPGMRGSTFIMYDIIIKKAPKGFETGTRTQRIPWSLKGQIKSLTAERVLSQVAVVYRPFTTYGDDLLFGEQPASMRRRGVKKGDLVATIRNFEPLRCLDKNHGRGAGGKGLDEILKDLKQKQGVKVVYMWVGQDIREHNEEYTEEYKNEWQRLLRSRGFSRTRNKAIFAKRL